MLVSIDTSPISDQWTESFSFYAFSIPLPGTTRYVVKTSVPHTVSNEVTTHVSRHKLTTSLFETSWDFMMDIYVYPAAPDDCLDVIPNESFAETGYNR